MNYPDFSGRYLHRGNKRALSIIAVCSLLLVTSCSSPQKESSVSSSPSSESSEPQSSSELSSQKVSSQMVSSQMPPEPEPEEPAAPSFNPSTYEFGTPVPKSPAVSNSYFDDSVFIGDSRTEGFMLYSGLTSPAFLTHKGLTVKTVFSNQVVKNKAGQLVSIMQALSEKTCGKVYIMLGVNELGWNYPDVFIQEYGKVIDEVKRVHPNAAIYIQSILPVSAVKSSSDAFINNPRIQSYNAKIQVLCKEKQAYYLDVGSAVKDSSGALFADASTDGVHLNKAYCAKWLEYLKHHTVSQ